MSYLWHVLINKIKETRGCIQNEKKDLLKGYFDSHIMDNK